MFTPHSVRSCPFTLWLITLLAMASGEAAAAQRTAHLTPTADCTQAMLMNSTEVLRGYSDAEGTLVRVNVEQPGLLSLELATSVDATAEPRLGFYECGSPMPPVIQLERSAGRMLLRVRRAGSYTFRVGAQDGDHLGDFRLIAGFTKNEPRNNETIIVDPSPDGKPTQTPTSGSVEPDPESPVENKSVAVAMACLAGIEDDHGDAPSCATMLRPGQAIEGMLRNAWGDDEDVFMIELTTLRTLTFEVASSESTSSAPALALVGRLQDVADRSLVRHETERGLNGVWRLNWTLEPGIYFLRLAGRDGTEGSYRIEVQESDW